MEVNQYQSLFESYLDMYEASDSEVLARAQAREKEKNRKEQEQKNRAKGEAPDNNFKLRRLRQEVSGKKPKSSERKENSDAVKAVIKQHARDKKGVDKDPTARGAADDFEGLRKKVGAEVNTGNPGQHAQQKLHDKAMDRLVKMGGRKRALEGAKKTPSEASDYKERWGSDYKERGTPEREKHDRDLKAKAFKEKRKRTSADKVKLNNTTKGGKVKVTKEDVLNYMIYQGYADNGVSAEVMLEHMSDLWLDQLIEIVEEELFIIEEELCDGAEMILEYDRFAAIDKAHKAMMDKAKKEGKVDKDAKYRFIKSDK